MNDEKVFAHGVKRSLTPKRHEGEAKRLEWIDYS